MILLLSLKLEIFEKHSEFLFMQCMPYFEIFSPLPQQITGDDKLGILTLEGRTAFI